MMLLDRQSALYRLPSGLDRRQLFYFDGLLHTAEIAHVCHERLNATLTELASHTGTDYGDLVTMAYIDAWSIVDAIDRFSQLLNACPNVTLPATDLPQETFAEAAQQVRTLRNFAAHIATRADQIIANEGTALGTLSWLTITSPSFPEADGLMCALIPGTVVPGEHPVPVLGTGTVYVPTSRVHLAAGNCHADLSSAYRSLMERVTTLGGALEHQLHSANQLQGSPRGDCFFKQPVKVQLSAPQ
jgi:hypothetical protein